MKGLLFLVTALFAGMTTAFPQMKMQFVEAEIGQAIMAQGNGYSLFDKAVGDNHAFCDLIHVGWGRDASRSIGACVGAELISIPVYDEVAAALTLGFEMRRYLEISHSLRCFSGFILGGIYVANGYTMAGEKNNESRFGLSLNYSVGTEMAIGEHLYIGASVHFSANPMLTSTFKPSSVTPDKGKSVFWGNKIMLTAGYRL